jgi:predicted kinase
MFIVFGGLPGTGKSTIAPRLARRLGAVYLRVDSIEEAIRTSTGIPVGTAGYTVCYRLAADNLMVGRTVIADSVNPLKVTRDSYKAVAEQAGVAILEVETWCSDQEQHRKRVETRQSTVAGLMLPTWRQVTERVYEGWDRPRLVLDTALLSVDESVDAILKALPISMNANGA